MIGSQGFQTVGLVDIDVASEPLRDLRDTLYDLKSLYDRLKSEK